MNPYARKEQAELKLISAAQTALNKLAPRTSAQQSLAQEMDECLKRWKAAHDPVQVAAMLGARLRGLVPLKPARQVAEQVFNFSRCEGDDETGEIHGRRSVRG